MSMRVEARGVKITLADATAEEAQLAERVIEKLIAFSAMPTIVTVPAELVDKVKVPSSGQSNGVIVLPDEAHFIEHPPTE